MLVPLSNGLDSNDLKPGYANHYTHIHIYIYNYIYMKVVLDSFMWKTSSSPKKNYFRQTLANPMFIFSGTCWPRLARKTLARDLLKFVPGPCSLSHFILWQLHLNIYVLL